MEKNVHSRDDRLTGAYWVFLVLLGMATAWRLFYPLMKELPVLGYVDFFVLVAALAVAGLQKGRIRNLIVSISLAALFIVMEGFKKGFVITMGGIFTSGSGVLALSYFMDFLYYVAIAVAAVFLFLDKERHFAITALISMAPSVIYSVLNIWITNLYTGDFDITWSWWIQNGLSRPLYFAITLLLSATLFFLKYDAFMAPIRKARRQARKSGSKGNRRQAD